MIYKTAKEIYFTSILHLIDIKKIENKDVINFYSSLHHYCELMMRYLVIEKDENQNTKDNGCSVNAIDLLGIIKKLYSSDFFKENKLDYENFPSLFKDISYIRNSYAHEGFANVSKKSVQDILNDYVICFYVLNKNNCFIEEFYDYLEINLIKTINEKFINTDGRLSKSEILGVYIEDFIKIFESTKFKNIIFDIKNCFLEIECPECKLYRSILKIPNYSHKPKTFIKINKDKSLFKCYICQYTREIKRINCQYCVLNGISSSFSYTEKNICIYCNHISEEYGDINCNFNLPKFEYVLNYNFNINNQLFKNRSTTDNNLQYRIFYNKKNSYNKIKSIKLLESFFNDVISDNRYVNYLEMSENDNYLRNIERNRFLFKSNNYKYLTYWNSFFSFKNCVYIHLRKSVPLSSYFPIFEYKFFKTNLYYDIMKYIKEELNDLISKTENENLIKFINGELFYEINEIIKKNIFSNQISENIETVIENQLSIHIKRNNTDKIINDVWFSIIKGKYEIPDKTLDLFNFIKKHGDVGISYQKLPEDLYTYYEKKILNGKKKRNKIGNNIYQAENIILEAFGLYECDGILNFSKMTDCAKKFLKNINVA